MQSKAKIVLQIQTDPQKAKKQAKTIGKDVANQVNKGASQITFGEKIKKQFDLIKDGVGGVGESLGKLGGLGKVFVGGWISAVVAGVTFLAKVGMEVYDKLTVTADEMIKKGEALSKIANDKMKQIFADQGDADAYIQRLIELNKVQQMSMAQRLQSIAIINQLTKTYGDLGLSVSDATGRILGLDQALEKVRKQNNYKAVEAAQKDVEAKKMSVKGAMDKMITQWIGGFFSLSKGAFDYFHDNYGNSLNYKNNIHKAGLNVKFNEKKWGGTEFGGGRELTEKQQKLVKGWNYGGLQEKKKFLEWRLSQATIDSQIEAYKNLIAKIDELIIAENVLNNVKKTGFKTNKEYLNHLKEENANIQKLRVSVKKLKQEYEKSRNARIDADFYAGLSTPEIKISYQKVKEQSVGKQFEDISKKYGKLNQELFLAEKFLQAAMQGGNQDEIATAYKRVNDLTKEIAKTQEALIKKANEYHNIQDQIERQKKAQRDADLKALKTDEEKIKFLEKEIQAQKRLQKTYNKGADEAKARVTSYTEDKTQNADKLKTEKTRRADLIQKLGTYADLQGIDSFKQILALKDIIEDVKKKMSKALQKGDAENYEKATKRLKQYEQELNDYQKEANRVNQWLQQEYRKGFNAEVPDFWKGDAADYYFLLKDIEKLRLSISIYEKQDVQLSKSINEAKKSQTRQEKEALKAKTLQMQAQAEIKKLQKKSQDYYDKQKSDLDGQLQVERLLLQGRYEQAETLKFINSLKEQGLIKDQKEIDAIMQQKKALKDLNIARSIQSQGYGILDKVGQNNKQYQYQKRIRELEQANGKQLTPQQKDKVKLLVDLEWKLKDLENLKPDFSSLEIKTNDLTRRGGFMDGAYVPSMEKVNEQIRDYNAKSVSLLNQIKNTLQKGGII